MKVLLSFDTEEFDVPREHGVNFTMEEGMDVSIFGTNMILDVLNSNNVHATFFCTGNFANNAPDVIQRIKDEGHEIACHGVDHWNPKESDVAESKIILEKVAGVQCSGYRQPRMFPVDNNKIKESGYLYNSSLNPAFIPGRYMHLSSPRTWFIQDGIVQIPASVTPTIRFPLFWLSLHILPQNLYHLLALRTLNHDGYLVTYFHPWEFYPLRQHPEFRLPFIITHNSGDAMKKRLEGFIKQFKAKGVEFCTFHTFVEKVCLR